MKTFEIKIKSREQLTAESIQAFEAAQAGRKFRPVTGVYFTSLEAVRGILTERRLALLHLIKEKKPESINQLAKLADRDFKNVHADIALLERYGLVRVQATAGRKKTEGRKLSVPYQAINIHATV